MNTFRILACCSVLAGAGAAKADEADYANPDRPGIADGSTVVGAGRFEIESGFQAEWRAPDGGDDRTLYVPTLLRFGLSKTIEARVETNSYYWERDAEKGHAVVDNQGAAPVSLGVKAHFLDSEGPKQPSMGVIVRVFPPSGAHGFGDSQTTGDVRLAADWDFAPKFSLNPNLGIGSYQDAAGRRFTAGLFAMTLNYNPSQRLNLLVDTGVQAPEQRAGRTSVIIDAGIAFMANKDVQIDLSVGAGAHGTTPPHHFLSAGISKRF